MLLSSFIRFLRRPPVGVFYYSKHHRKNPTNKPKTNGTKSTRTQHRNHARQPVRHTYNAHTRPRFFLTIKRNTKNTTAAQNAENKQPEAPKQYI